MNLPEAYRIDCAASCRDTEHIPKVQDAGKLFLNADGEMVQRMHNGIMVIADGYYGKFNSDIVERLGGHHEPQEEKVFFEVLKLVKPGGIMIELGVYWGYYSLWFHQSVSGARNYMVEPVVENMELGMRNFTLNNYEGHFFNALIGEKPCDSSQPHTITMDDFVAKEKLAAIEILHSDIQGHEYAMLLGARNLLREKRVRFIFISTHGYLVHAKCLGFLRKCGWNLICEHTLGESYSVDGLIVACADASVGKIAVTHRPQDLIGKIKSLVCRTISHFMG